MSTPPVPYYAWRERTYPWAWRRIIGAEQRYGAPVVRVRSCCGQVPAECDCRSRAAQERNAK